MIFDNQLRNLLIVGPLPPPIGGSPLTLQVILNELKEYSTIQTSVINTSPSTKVNKKMTGFNLEKVKRMFFILIKFYQMIRKQDVVLVFANDLFAFFLVPLLVMSSRLYKKPIFIKPVGSNLDLFIEQKGKLVKKIMLYVIKSSEGLLAQTKVLTDYFQNQGCKNAFYLPGCRPIKIIDNNPREPSENLRIIYLGHITIFKGPLVLLDALKILEKRGILNITCDFYGPIHDNVENQFTQKIEDTYCAYYKGMVEPGMGSEIISHYDLLVLPTCYDTEGHPGVIIEAMHVGVPVITTQKRTLYELITPGENGLLVPAEDAPALAEAIQTMMDGELRKRMGKANLIKGFEFRSDIVVGKLVNYLFNNSNNKSEILKS